MITLDIRTLSIVAMLTLFLLSAAMAVLWRSNPEERAPAYWALGSGLIAAGFLFLSLRAITTLFVSIVLANGLIVFGYGCFLLGTQAYARRPLSWGLVVALTALQLFLFLVLTYGMPDIIYRIVVISLVVAAFNVLSAHSMLRAPRPRTLPELFTAGVFLVNALFMLFRGLYVLGEERISGLMEASTVHAFAFLFVIFTSFGLGLGLSICMADRLNATLRKELRSRDRFFSIVAHDLKNAFNSVLGFADLLNRHMKEQPESADEHSRELATYIQSGSENAFILASNLLDWARIKIVTDEPKLETVQLGDIVGKVAGSLKAAFPEKEFQIDIDVGDLTLHTDRNALETVLRNLIGNAIKFSHPGGRIRVSAQEAKGGRVVISVSDQGIGVPDKLRDRLFDVVEKTSTPGTAGELGTGLGLPLCKELLDKLGEDIWLEPASGRGTTVSFTVEKQQGS